MSQQPTLFDPPEEAWIARIWRALKPGRRQAIVSVLAEMGRAATGRRPPRARAGKEGRHEP